MAVKEILLLGDERLYETSDAVMKEELGEIKVIVEDLHDTLMDYRRKYGAGRAIAAPQIGFFKRVLYMNTGEAVTFINPKLEFLGDEKIELWDDCMSFPELLVRVKRHKECRIYYKDLEWKDCMLELKDDLSELIQHEYDHLDGILAVQRAINNKSFKAVKR